MPAEEEEEERERRRAKVKGSHAVVGGVFSHIH